MINIGKYNILTVARDSAHGLYLADEQGAEVLLPGRFITDGVEVGKPVKVFVYTDSDNRPIATTETPYATVGQFAFLQVNDVNAVGAFLDWGIGKDLLVPFSEQRSRMMRGGIYPVYVYLDHATRRVVASAKLDRYLGNVPADYHAGQRVKILVMEHTDDGYKVIVDDLHRGMVYDSDAAVALAVESVGEGYVKKVREDGKIDVAVGPTAAERVSSIANRILTSMRRGNGRLALSDNSTPEEIRSVLGCSKKDFKKAVGHLYKQGKIAIGEEAIELSE